MGTFSSVSYVPFVSFIEEFKKCIEDITFENLKVTYYDIEKFQYHSEVTIYIENAYEVID